MKSVIVVDMEGGQMASETMYHLDGTGAGPPHFCMPDVKTSHEIDIMNEIQTLQKAF